LTSTTVQIDKVATESFKTDEAKASYKDLSSPF
jgi:hypothetical protein